MKVSYSVDDFNKSTSHLESSKNIGFVPTMGSLHEGHLSLIEVSKKNNEFVICSIFVNPTQFNDKSDFEKYPKNIENDICLLEEVGCDLVFIPSADEIYGTDYTQPYYELGYIESILEGKYRPGHFQGVCAVIERLVEIVKPTSIYLGKKDFQQCMVINRLINLKKLEAQIKLHFCETKREEDGLALSSRNLRLSAFSRLQAAHLYKAMKMVKDLLVNSKNEIHFEELKTKMEIYLIENGFESVDYFELIDSELNSISVFNNQNKDLPAHQKLLN